MSRNEINPKTLIMDTQMTRLMMSGDYEKVNSKLEKYHVHSTKGLDIFSMNQIYLLFRMRRHFMLAVVVNCSGLISEDDEGRSG